MYKNYYAFISNCLLTRSFTNNTSKISQKCETKSKVKIFLQNHVGDDKLHRIENYWHLQWINMLLNWVINEDRIFFAKYATDKCIVADISWLLYFYSPNTAGWWRSPNRIFHCTVFFRFRFWKPSGKKLIYNIASRKFEKLKQKNK